MLRPLLALFQRALGRDANLSRVYLFRLGLLLTIFVGILSAHSSARGAPGLWLLSVIVKINMIFIVVAGLELFASAVSEEKEERMLGLLRMTGLNPLGILLGKSTSRMIVVLLLLLSQLPFTMLAVTLGGVTSLQVSAAYVTMLSFVVLLANVALFWSVVMPRVSAAVAATLATLVGLHVATDLAKLPELSPFSRLGVIFETGYAAPAWSLQATAAVGLSLVFFCAAWLLFDRIAVSERDAEPSRGGVRKRGWTAPKRVHRWPVFWKDFHFSTGGKTMLAGRVLVAGAVPAFVAANFREDEVGVNMLWIYGAFLAVDGFVQAIRMFGDERRRKTLTALVTLPTTLTSTIWQKTLARLLATLPWIIGLVAALTVALANDPGEAGTLLLFAFIGVAQYLFMLHLIVFMTLRVKAGSVPIAIGVTLLVGVMPFGMILAPLCMPVMWDMIARQLEIVIAED
jgi:ABC-type transport system involved in multi-copper enzyme maturation permease subunit